MKTKEEFLEWIRDVYAMEKAMEAGLERQIRNENAGPRLREQAHSHLAETHDHTEALAACLKKFGADPGYLNASPALGIEILKDLDSAFAGDERVVEVLSA